MEQTKLVATILQGDNGLFCLTLVHFKMDHATQEASVIAKHGS